MELWKSILVYSCSYVPLALLAGVAIFGAYEAGRNSGLRKGTVEVHTAYGVGYAFGFLKGWIARHKKKEIPEYRKVYSPSEMSLDELWDSSENAWDERREPGFWRYLESEWQFIRSELAEQNEIGR
jgi:hypothetical protein